MKKIAVLWFVIFVVSAISIGTTHQYFISPLWVVNALAAFYLIKLRKEISYPVYIFLFCFSAVFCASFLFDSTKTNEFKILLSAIGALQIQCFISVYYAVSQRLQTLKFKQTALLTIPTVASAFFGSFLFMVLFDLGDNYYEFIDYFLEQCATGLAVICLLTGMRFWKNIGNKEYFYLSSVSLIQYVISMDRIFYACMILPLLMCFYALRYNIREFAWLIGVLVLLCSIYVSLPLAGEYWTESEIYMLSRLSAYRLSLVIYLIIFLFICEMYIVNRRLYTALERLSFNDELTHLKARRYVKELIGKSPLKQGSAILLDIDNFKQVNDGYGHQIGDEVLQYMSMLLREICPSSAIIARWGGEEFLVLLPYSDQQCCEEVCQAILEECQHRRFESEKMTLTVTFSMGASSFQYFNSQNYAQVLQHTDACLYQAKAEGKNRFVYA